MFINKRIFLSWVFVIIWASIIFMFSCMDTNESNNKSKTTIKSIVDKTVQTTNTIGITDKHPSDIGKKKLIEKLNKPLRKVAHASEYFIFVIFLIFALENSGVKGKYIYLSAVVICFFYACGDEFHQTFVSGRTGQFIDALIDTFGGLLGCFVIYIIKAFKKI